MPDYRASSCGSPEVSGKLFTNYADDIAMLGQVSWASDQSTMVGYDTGGQVQWYLEKSAGGNLYIASGLATSDPNCWKPPVSGWYIDPIDSMGIEPPPTISEETAGATPQLPATGQQWPNHLSLAAPATGQQWPR